MSSYNHLLFFRIDPIGSPFRNMDAGVLDQDDPENLYLFNEGQKNYLS
jgi:hypothetical protein